MSGGERDELLGEDVGQRGEGDPGLANVRKGVG